MSGFNLGRVYTLKLILQRLNTSIPQVMKLVCNYIVNKDASIRDHRIDEVKAWPSLQSFGFEMNALKLLSYTTFNSWIHGQGIWAYNGVLNLFAKHNLRVSYILRNYQSSGSLFNSSLF